MAVPKRKTSKSRRNKRRSHIHFDSKNVVENGKYPVVSFAEK